ncbi:MAG: dihydroorotase, partial [Acetobacteraceae bacterium]|nr:dihydroorotase [Acetobacteraceae bacterium]
DLKRQRMIEESWIVSPCGWTPFAGQVCTGWPVGTIVRGAVVMRDDAVVGTPRGGAVNFAEARG